MPKSVTTHMGDVCRKKDNRLKGDLESEDRKVMKCDGMGMYE